MTRRLSDTGRDLRGLASLHGVRLSYTSVATGARIAAGSDALLAVRRALGAPVETGRDAADAVRERRQETGRRRIEPVIVAWGSGPARFDLKCPAGSPPRDVACELVLEDGTLRRWKAAARPGRRGEGGALSRIPIPGPLPPGYHALAVETGRERHEALVIAAPPRAYQAEGPGGSFLWGIFLPLYAARSARNWGAGDLGDLGGMLDWTRGLGGEVVATLPLLAAFLDEPCEPSPYSPVSRMFWNEFYLDISRIPDLGRCPRPRRRIGSAAFRSALGRLRRADHVDHREGMSLRRSVLEELAEWFFARTAHPEAPAFRDYLASHPAVQDYARFRATCERRLEPWGLWPARAHGGRLGGGDYDERSRLYHLYVQWRFEQQIGALSGRAREFGPGLYLDFPLGVHPDGYDAWRHRDLFASGVSGGAPPDNYSRLGQNWGFRPMHPDRIREDGYAYLRACLAHHFRHAGILRIDHVMSLHRLFWIPDGMDAGRGVYVRYRPEELYAILSLESHRHRAMVVGEDLGTVPREVRPMMARRGLLRTWVLQRAILSDPAGALEAIPASSVVAMNTHDHPPFAAWWRGLDIEDRLKLEMIGEDRARRERDRRAAAVRALTLRFSRGATASRRRPPRGGPLRAAASGRILSASLRRIAASPARVLIVNVEDLWGERRPQNTPGTTWERPNWKRKLRYDSGAVRDDPAVRGILRAIARSREAAHRRRRRPA